MFFPVTAVKLRHLQSCPQYALKAHNHWFNSSKIKGKILSLKGGKKSTNHQRPLSSKVLFCEISNIILSISLIITSQIKKNI